MLYDKGVSLKVKGKIYKTAVSLKMMYEPQYLAINKKKALIIRYKNWNVKVDV